MTGLHFMASRPLPPGAGVPSAMPPRPAASAHRAGGPAIDPRRDTLPWAADRLVARSPGPHWDAADMPLTVWIAPMGVEAPLMSPQAMFDIVCEWQRASTDRVRFTLLAPDADPATAAIAIHWCDTPVMGREYEVGHAQRTVRANGRITRAVITLQRAPLIDQTLLPSQRLQRLHTTLLHETGHALGLEHSGCQDDVMHHRGWRNTRLSMGDQTQLAQRYP